MIRKIFILFIFISIIISCHSKNQSQIPSDKEMIDSFLLRENEFNSFKEYIFNDSGFKNYPLVRNFKDSLKIMNLDYVKKVKENLNIIRVYKIDDYIEITTFEKGNSTWGIEKGYYYKKGKMDDFEDNYNSEKVVEGDLWEECRKIGENNFTVYKNIKGNWYLFLRYDK
ncbi:hypothetical protein ETU09_09520 [Apibacter muscae]|uniref:DUF4948 domain-containing protein n=1 Tax=Apibacter muscae TaxID=2509004 RepID=A0A563D9B4_9FLAO|nr:hypothetical protein [Apibacter muscae]TWP26790.1 hypothetical protein ETU09_09520 [Apibacter muscae]